uniref:Uncharacterized protein n=1 Tax=Romanomermis culicivorax TaxID=13658 RepID=A0A915KRF7_ROMCU
MRHMAAEIRSKKYINKAPDKNLFDPFYLRWSQELSFRSCLYKEQDQSLTVHSRNVPTLVCTVGQNGCLYRSVRITYRDIQIAADVILLYASCQYTYCNFVQIIITKALVILRCGQRVLPMVKVTHLTFPAIGKIANLKSSMLYNV